MSNTTLSKANREFVDGIKNIEVLQAIGNYIGERVETMREESRNKTIAAVNDLIRKAGFDPAMLLRGGKRGAKVPAKYRDPQNPQNTWTGRGRTPNWVNDRLAKGAKLESFLIADGEASASAEKEDAE